MVKSPEIYLPVHVVFGGMFVWVRPMKIDGPVYERPCEVLPLMMVSISTWQKKLMVQFIIKKYIYSKNILYIKTEVTTLIYV